MKKTRELLCFLYYFPPMPGSAPKRNFRIISGLAPYFERIQIITSHKITDTNNLPNDCEVTSTKPLDYRSLLTSVSSVGFIEEKNKKNSVARFVVKVLNSFPFNILFGEGGSAYWLRNYFKGVRLIHETGITHLYSSFRPITDHFTAYMLKLRFPHLFWIADFRDLIIDPHYQQQIFPKIDHFIYKKIFRRANIITTVSEGFAINLKKYNSNSISVMNGVDDFSNFPAAVKNEYFKIVYTGSMFLNERNAEPLFAAIKELIANGRINSNLVQIIYAGKDAYEWQDWADKYELTSLLKLKGMLSGYDAIQLQNDSNINVLLTIASSELQGILTGKLVEYLTAGNPILAIIKGSSDIYLNEIFLKLDAGLVATDDYNSIQSISKFILKYYNEWKISGSNSKIINESILQEEFSMKYLLKPLIDQL